MSVDGLVAFVSPVGPRKLESLRTRGQFGATLRLGRRERRTLIAIAAHPNQLGRTRVGYSVGKRVGGAVVRNLVRRRLRELMRQQVRTLEAGADSVHWDVVITAQPPAAAASFTDLAAELDSALRGATQGRSRRGPRQAARRADAEGHR